jgi:protein SCO1/2
VATLVAFTLVTGCGGGDAPAHQKPTGRAYHWIDRPLPAALRSATLYDGAGKTVTLKALRGKIVVISDMLTLCQGTCPLDTAELVATARHVNSVGDSDRVVFLSVTVDPRRDLRARLTAFRRQYRPAPGNWYVLSGATPSIDALWDALGVYRQLVPERHGRDQAAGVSMTYDVTHSDEVFFFDRTGRERCTIQGVPHVAPGGTTPPQLRSQTQGWSERDALTVLARLLDAPT